MAVPAVSTRHILGDEPKSRPHPASPLSEPPLDELRATQFQASITPSKNSDASLRGKELRSTYHIYHEKESHKCISTSVDSTKERRFGPTIKECKEKRRRKREAEGKVPSPSPSAADDGSFFLHTPYLAFHDPPRVLYIGNSKHSHPAVLIHTSLFWRTWKIQLGPSIATPGVLDPRGVVCWRHNGGDRKALKADDRKLKGYKVRTWRLWGETGKRYVHGVKAARKAGVSPDPDNIEEASRDPIVPAVLEKDTMPNTIAVKEPHVPARADEVVYLKWTSPLSRDPRRYHFHYAGIDFFWKGTGTVRESRRCGAWLHFNHLKLVARLPVPRDEKLDDPSPQPEVCLGKYTSSIAAKKHGILELYDGAIWRLLSEYVPASLPQTHVQGHIRKAGGDREPDEEELLEQVHGTKKTTLYQVIVATAMCMIIGEKQKRETIRQIIELAASEGAGGAGGS
ncbi:uncharacterized protein BDR25DRAFT_342461 [Lindgomyces ingoldianus]|uniref:Uncharacterized protein n=1 Tax=Lindgomyces ingoldianus TaxID=673940 RepID=A0ACB6QXY7_9PLEO|nr:uncharacterized protein BDR25DRAFT_342461 [Lindgomyces ingoldianus]KAF2471854.1 hypothetical protein BDR25DRAFT_342461 [Lindgomyces ingoldianus]